MTKQKTSKSKAKAVSTEEVEVVKNDETSEVTIPAGPPPAGSRPSLTFRPNYAASAVQKAPRAGSKRAVVLDRLLNGGLTIEEVQEVTAAMGPNMGWDRRTAMEGVRLIAKHNGYGLKTDANGKIEAFLASDSAAGAA